ncbi:nucleotidyl transferase AbiEii/AbiGii toxin family protein [Pedobacter sp. N23S346]|uniref:nucleotidyl transferase AbiEii/AbiGii toxin family protein n=1 Tax=Pedobacter sp. N23S346 TaxID=3402750 RepID=UPI003AD30907
MIFQKEVADIAQNVGVAKTVIDKDWVLGHFIAAMYTVPEIRDNLIFKGGTCLRKCWFDDYRFSEDLDFTSTNESFNFTDKNLLDICEKVTAHAGIKTHIASLKPIKFQDKHVGFEAIVKYWGADHSKNEAPPPVERWQTKIKIEIILYEKMIFEPIQRELFHPYSDSLLINTSIPCYAIEEVLSEKIRALIQRSYTAPRDYYDIWYLSNNMTGLEWNKIIAAFHVKIKYKNLEFTGIEQLINPKSERAVKLAWSNSLGHQIKRDTLPDFDVVKGELEALLNKNFVKNG